MTILVTGGTGFVGSNIIQKLVARNKPVRAMVRPGSADKVKLRLGKLGSQVEVVEGDVRDRKSLPRLMKDVSSVIHTVAVSIEKGDATYEEVNYQGTINIVDAAEDAGVQRFIFISQNGADSSIKYRFLQSKGKAQDYVHNSKLAATSLRPSAIFGPQDEFFNTFARLLRLTPLVFPLVGGGKAEFQPVHVSDVAAVAVRSLEDPTTIGLKLDLGGPEVLTLGEIERRVIKALDTSRLLFPAPVWLLRPAVVVMQRVLAGSPVTTSLLDLLAVPNTVPNNALVSHFKMEPIAFSGDNISYLKKATAGEALRKFFTGKVTS